jgi:hypothetical protein
LDGRRAVRFLVAPPACDAAVVPFVPADGRQRYTVSLNPALLGAHERQQHRAVQFIARCFPERGRGVCPRTSSCRDNQRRARQRFAAVAQQCSSERTRRAGLCTRCTRPRGEGDELQRCTSQMTDERDSARQQRRGLDYATLQAHGLREPRLVEHAAFIEPPAPARAVSPPEREAAVQLVKNEAGRWELTRALGELEPPPAALKRPGADEAAAARKRKARAAARLLVAFSWPLALASEPSCMVARSLRRRWKRAYLRPAACST